MRTMMTVRCVAALMLAASLTVNAQGTGAASAGGEKAGGQGAGAGAGGQHQRPSPEQMATQMMGKFDADKDGKLSQGELTQALEAMRAHHPQGAAGGGQGGGAAGAQQGGAEGKRPEPPAADKVAAQMIEKFASDKKGMSQAEFVKALEEHRANRGKPGGAKQAGPAAVAK